MHGMVVREMFAVDQVRLLTLRGSAFWYTSHGSG